MMLEIVFILIPLVIFKFLSNWVVEMRSVFRQHRARLKDDQLTNILDKLTDENRFLHNRFDRLDERYQQWIDNERISFLKRIEQLEHDNRQLLDLYRTSQNQTELSIRSITNLILKILLLQQIEGELFMNDNKRRFQNLFGQCFLPCNTQELRKPTIERQQNGYTRSFSCPLDNSRSTINDQSIWYHQVKEQDQKTRNYSSGLPNHSSRLATVKSKNDRLSTAQSNKLYYLLNNEKSASNRSTGIPIVPVDNANTNSHRKQPASVTFNNNQTQTRSTYSNHERLPQRTTTKITTPRVPAITIRPPTTNTRSRPPPANQKTSLANKTPARPRYALSKATEPPPPPSIRPAPKTSKTRIPVVSKQSARVTDLDTAIAEQKQKTLKLCDRPKLVTPSPLIQPIFFSKDTVKHVRTVRSQELKLFSCHLIPEVSVPKNESSSTLTPSSYESIHDCQFIEKQNDDPETTANISGVCRNFSEDSLNEHHPLSATIGPTIQPGYFLSANEDFSPPYAPASSLVKPKLPTSLVHRLVFPDRLGRLIFHRRILSDSDIYQKNCSKDQEVLHHVYHLDTIRDYSMEFYMLTTYASDSQLRAWLDDDDEEIVDQYNENRFLSSDEERKTSNDSLITEEEELDWCSEPELLDLDHSNENYFDQSWSVPAGASNHQHSTPLPSESANSSDLLLREILNQSWIEQNSASNSIEQETGIEQLENDSTSSIITEEFQRDFYYLCPMTKTTSFATAESNT